MTGKVTKVTNVRLFNGFDEDLKPTNLWFRDGIIIDPRNHFWDGLTYDELIDGQGLILSPSFIDIQINGAFGIDFSNTSLSSDDILYVSQHLPQYGVTSYVPTCITSCTQVYSNLGKVINDCKGHEKGAKILGLHLEGPLITKYGAHNPTDVPEVIDSLQTLELIYTSTTLQHTKIITLAPEVPGIIGLIPELAQHFVVSLGHSNCSFEQGMSAIEGGAKCITHIFNAMISFHHRNLGLVGCMLEPNMYYSMICDQNHLHDTVINMTYKSNKNCICISDGMSLMGYETCHDGNSQIGEQSVTSCQGKITIKDSEILAGAITPLNICLKNFKHATKCSIAQALKTVTYNPAKLLGLNLGQLQFDMPADFVLINDNFDIIATYIGGEIVYKRPI